MASCDFKFWHSIFRPYVTIWRPMISGSWTFPPIGLTAPIEKQRHSSLRSIAFSEVGKIYEPCVNVYHGSGCVIFLVDKAGQPIHRLPEDWIGLSVWAVGPRLVSACPIQADLNEYTEFRKEQAKADGFVPFKRLYRCRTRSERDQRGKLSVLHYEFAE